jgi:Na+-translocating ferredoxin:NAD+ oxidoreductase RnfG subunit
VPEGAAAAIDQFDAISGATLSSDAVRDIVNAARRLDGHSVSKK